MEIVDNRDRVQRKLSSFTYRNLIGKADSFGSCAHGPLPASPACPGVAVYVVHSTEPEDRLYQELPFDFAGSEFRKRRIIVEEELNLGVSISSRPRAT